MRLLGQYGQQWAWCKHGCASRSALHSTGLSSAGVLSIALSVHTSNS